MSAKTKPVPLALNHPRKPGAPSFAGFAKGGMPCDFQFSLFQFRIIRRSSPVAAANDMISAEGAHFVVGNSKQCGDRIVRDRGVCGGEPVFKGTRVTLRTVLASLAAGDSTENILTDFPTLKPEDVRAAIAFAAASAEKDLPVRAIPHIR
jgi:uncharacterized protein (DUF433 family)